MYGTLNAHVPPPECAFEGNLNFRHTLTPYDETSQEDLRFMNRQNKVVLHPNYVILYNVSPVAYIITKIHLLAYTAKIRANPTTDPRSCFAKSSTSRKSNVITHEIRFHEIQQRRVTKVLISPNPVTVENKFNVIMTIGLHVPQCFDKLCHRQRYLAKTNLSLLGMSELTNEMSDMFKRHEEGKRYQISLATLISYLYDHFGYPFRKLAMHRTTTAAER